MNCFPSSDKVVCQHLDGVAVSLSAGVVVVLVFLESIGTTCGFLTVWGLEDPTLSSVIAFRFIGCYVLGLLCNALFRAVVACFNFLNLLATIVFDALPSMNMVLLYPVQRTFH